MAAKRFRVAILFASPALLGARRTSAHWLRWSAMLHEIGMFLTYTGYHKHSAYLLTHHEMPGFSRAGPTQTPGWFLDIVAEFAKAGLSEVTVVSTDHFSKLLLLLRIATRIHRRRSPKRTTHDPLGHRWETAH